MQSMSKAFVELEKDLAAILREFPDERRALHEQIAVDMKRAIDNQIATSLNDSQGHVRAWQEARTGSGGGYAAISAISGETGPNSPGAITNYLENGHEIRKPKSGKRYRPRIRMSYVNGRHFYKSAENVIERAAETRAQALLDKLAARLEGKT